MGNVFGGWKNSFGAGLGDLSAFLLMKVREQSGGAKRLGLFACLGGKRRF